MPRTAGSEPGTKVIVLTGGPPEWDGTVAGIARTCERAERWDHTADLACVWHATEEYREVQVVHDYSSGRESKPTQAQVFTYIGYREDEDAMQARGVQQASTGTGEEAQGSLLQHGLLSG